VLNSFLQMIEQDNSHSLILAATNHPDMLDHALFRRFDDVLTYGLPDAHHCAELLQARLCNYTAKGIDWKHLATIAVGMSHAEVTRASHEVVKNALINNRDTVLESEIGQSLQERKEIVKHLEQTS